MLVISFYSSSTATVEETNNKPSHLNMARQLLIKPKVSSKGFCERTYTKYFEKKKKTTILGLSPRANYTDRATAACRRSDCQLFRIEGATWSA
jgi:hypothetical protein